MRTPHPRRDGPAAEAGIRLGDRLLAVDGRLVSARDPALAATLLASLSAPALAQTIAITGGKERMRHYAEHHAADSRAR